MDSTGDGVGRGGAGWGGGVGWANNVHVRLWNHVMLVGGGVGGVITFLALANMFHATL